MDWAEQLCSALNYLHLQRPPIIFRDLKPSQHHAHASGKVKLIDFGIARVFAPAGYGDTSRSARWASRAGAVWQGADRRARRRLRAWLHALPVTLELRSGDDAVCAAAAQHG